MARRQVTLLAAALAVAAPILGACGARPPHPSQGAGAAPSRTPTYQVDQAWDAPPGWRLRVAGMRCGPAATLRPGSGSEEPDVCLVAVAFTNLGQTPRPFSGTAEAAGPTWRVVGYDAAGREFHGHGQLDGATVPGASGTSELIFEVPAGLTLSRVLVGDTFVRLSSPR